MPLHYAAARGYKAIVELLLANKANPSAVNHNNSTPLHAAVKKEFRSVAEVLLEAGADVNVVNKVSGLMGSPETYSHDLGTPLHIAVWNGYKPLTELILARRPDVNLRNQFGETPLHLVWNRVEFAALLVAAKADVNARVQIEGNTLGKTPLCIAAGGHADMVEFLLKNGADPNVRFGDGRNPDNTPAVLILAAGHSKNRLKPGLRTALGSVLRGSESRL